MLKIAHESYHGRAFKYVTTIAIVETRLILAITQIIDFEQFVKASFRRIPSL